MYSIIYYCCSSSGMDVYFKNGLTSEEVFTLYYSKGFDSTGNFDICEGCTKIEDKLVIKNIEIICDTSVTNFKNEDTGIFTQLVKVVVKGSL